MKTSRFLLIIPVLILILSMCRTPPVPPVEEEIEEIVVEESYDVNGTWFWGDPRSMIIYQFRPDGTGFEISLNDMNSFYLIYRHFNYTFDRTVIDINFSDTARPRVLALNYERTAVNRIHIREYLPNVSPTFIRQEPTLLEGLWHSQAEENVSYIFGGRNFLVKLRNGVPFATGNFILADSSLIINDLYRCIDYHMLRWTRSTTPHETHEINLTGNQLTYTFQGRQFRYIKQ